MVPMAICSPSCTFVMTQPWYSSVYGWIGEPAGPDAPRGRMILTTSVCDGANWAWRIKMSTMSTAPMKGPPLCGPVRLKLVLWFSGLSDPNGPFFAPRLSPSRSQTLDATPPEPNNSNMFRTICPGPAAAGVMISMGYGSSNGWMADMPPPTGCGEVWLACWQNVIGWPPNVKIVKPEPPTRTLDVNVGSVPAIDYYP